MVPPKRLKSLQSSIERGGNDLFIIISPQAICKSWENNWENEINQQFKDFDNAVKKEPFVSLNKDCSDLVSKSDQEIFVTFHNYGVKNIFYSSDGGANDFGADGYF